MDTKLKNSHDWKDESKKLVEKAGGSRNFIVMVIAILLLYAACNMVASYPNYVSVINQEVTAEEYRQSHLEQIMRELMRGTIYLHVQEEPVTEEGITYKQVMELYGNDGFFLLKKFASCELTDREHGTTAALAAEGQEDLAREAGQEKLMDDGLAEDDVKKESGQDDSAKEPDQDGLSEGVGQDGLAQESGREDLSEESGQGSLWEEAGSYALRVRLTYDKNGELEMAEVEGSAADRELQYQLEQVCYAYDMETVNLKMSVSVPENTVAVYVMTNQALVEYLDLLGDEEVYEHDFSSVTLFEEGTGDRVIFTLGGLVSRMYAWMILIVLVALLIPFNRAWNIGKERIFCVPLEAVVSVWLILLLFANGFEYSVLLPALDAQKNWSGNGIARLFLSGRAYDAFVNAFVWFLLFAVTYWSATCLRAVFSMRGEYFRQRIWCVKRYRVWKAQKEEHKRAVAEGRAQKQRFSLRRCLRSWGDGIKGCFLNVYDALLHIDFQNRTNRTILTIVVVNFFVLLVITWLWFYGVFALLIYSALLFYFLRRYFDDIRRKYTLLLQSTNQLAAGNLGVEIEGDFGIYNPVKDELKKIQAGFQRAVQKEVKSERMKTELITNVSHDLKTPLTAIITYVDLLKNEQDEQKRKEYLEILERKSQRLKVLIEDLFEISKAASRTVKLDLMNVDIVGLLKQVVFENEDKIKAADVKFRWRLPEEKVVMALDSQKTYRIFENLVVNITKYALPGTRAYIDMQVSEKEVSIIMKNVSATEMDFNTEEITDRFVRGDASRNAEGSGLGLAIVKSFTELQKGTLKITTEADLFKICVTLPRHLVEPEQMMESVQAAVQEMGSEWKRETAQEMGSEWKREPAQVMMLGQKEGPAQEKDSEWKEESVVETAREMRMELAREMGLDNVEGAS